MNEKWNDFFEKYLPYIEILGDIADVLVHVSAKPSPKDFVAIGLASGRVVSKIVHKMNETSAEKFANYFEENGIEIWWVGEGLKAFLFDASDHIHIIEQGRNDKIVAIEFGKERFFIHLSSLKDRNQQDGDDPTEKRGGFIEKVGICKENWGIKIGQEEALFVEIRKKIWKDGKYLMIDKKNGLFYKPFKDFSHCIETSFIKELTQKIELAKEHGFLGRGFLIEGLPGTGKSLSSDFIVSKFKHKTIHVNLDFMENDHWNDMKLLAPMSFTDVLILIQIAKADFVIFDDLDYIQTWNQSKLLSFFEELNEFKSIVIASVNNSSKLLDALRRPGRLDEKIVVGGLDREILETILERDDLPFIDQFSNVPIAYVNEFKKRKVMYSQEKGLEFIQEFNESLLEPDPDQEDLDDDELKELERNG